MPALFCACIAMGTCLLSGGRCAETARSAGPRSGLSTASRPPPRLTARGGLQSNRGVRYAPFKASFRHFQRYPRITPGQAPQAISHQRTRRRPASGQRCLPIAYTRRVAPALSRARALHDGLLALRCAPRRGCRRRCGAQAAPVRALAGAVRFCGGRCVAGDGGARGVVDQPRAGCGRAIGAGCGQEEVAGSACRSKSAALQSLRPLVRARACCVRRRGHASVALGGDWRGGGGRFLAAPAPASIPRVTRHFQDRNIALFPGHRWIAERPRRMPALKAAA